jgi:O-antigen/teichoic acid export membrane protein
LSVPAGLIGGSVMQVFYPRFNEAVQNGENLAGLMLKATIGMGIVGFAPFVIVVAFGPFLFDLVFGGEWRTAGEYAQWLALWLFFAFLNRPAVSAMPALRSQDALLMYEVISVILRTIALYIGFSVLKSDIGAMSVFSVIGALLNAFLIMYVIHLCQIRRILSQKEETNE